MAIPTILNLHPSDPSEELTRLTKICYAISIFVFLSWLTTTMGCWTPITHTNPDIINGNEEAQEIELELELELEEAKEEIQRNENRNHHPDHHHQQENLQPERELQETEHDRLEAEAHALRLDLSQIPFWPQVKMVIIITTLITRWRIFFGILGIPFSGLRVFAVLFGGQYGAWGIGCVVLAWVVLHLGDVLGVEGAREVHLVVDEWAMCVLGVVGRGVVEVVGDVVLGCKWVVGILRGGSEVKEVERVERVWSAWEVEERERRALGLPIVASSRWREMIM